MIETDSICRESNLLSTVSRSARAGTQCDPDAASDPIREPRIRGSFTIGVRICEPVLSADGDFFNKLPKSEADRGMASDPRTRSFEPNVEA